MNAGKSNPDTYSIAPPPFGLVKLRSAAITWAVSAARCVILLVLPMLIAGYCAMIRGTGQLTPSWSRFHSPFNSSLLNGIVAEINEFPRIAEWFDVIYASVGLLSVSFLGWTTGIAVSFALPQTRARAAASDLLEPAVTSGLWATVIFPLTWYATVLLDTGELVEWTIVALMAGWVFIGPSLVLLDRDRGARMSQWRPMCPECGFTLRRQRGQRCQECGSELQSSIRYYRRWAFLRLVWDRVVRPSLAESYFRIVASILFLPCRASRGTAASGHMGRAVRWACVHVLLICFFLTMHSGRLVPAVDWLQSRRLGHGQSVVFSWATQMDGDLPRFAAESFAFWLVMCIAVLAIPLALSIWPGRRPREARSALIKWTLYSTCVPVAVWLMMLVSSLCFSHSHSVMRDTSIALPVRVVNSIHLVIPELPALSMGVWWAIGAGLHPYQERRGGSRVLALLAIFVVAGLLVRNVFMPLGALEALQC